jgi:hypothetical protein
MGTVWGKRGYVIIQFSQNKKLVLSCFCNNRSGRETVSVEGTGMLL